MKKPSKADAPSVEAHAKVAAIIAAESAVADKAFLAVWSAYASEASAAHASEAAK